MSILLPDALQGIADRLPLPTGERLRDLALHGELSDHLRRRLLEGLAELAADSDRADEDCLQRLRQQLGLVSDEALEAWRRRMGLDLSDLRRCATYPRRLQQATEDTWGPSLPGRFLERRADLDQVVLSLVRFRDPDLAQELWFQLREGELAFGELVERHATGSDRDRRGLVGPIPLQRLHPLLARVVSRYAERAVVPPIDIDGTVHLVRIESIQRAELDERVRGRLLLELREAWLAEQMARLQDRMLAEPGALTEGVVAT
ncbi:peptidylprolyl isomerase [Cyanobium sp. FGCU-6]|nr:peptidylprolyl isomerase [Cyanobium sp. FGCU6]